MVFLDIVKKMKLKSIFLATEKLQLLYKMVALLHNTEDLYPEQATVHNGQSFDYVVIGGGTAGCVVANRLTEDNSTVLLIEYGSLPPPSSDIPGFFSLLDYSEADWNQFSINDGRSSQAHKAKAVHMTQGKMLGGSSGLDYMIHIRGNKIDYDKWGYKEWKWDTILPYFKKLENMKDKAILKSKSSSLHGTKGYIGITRKVWKDKISSYLESFEEAGQRTILDQNGFEQLGFAEPQFTIDYETRQSTAVSYIRPIKHRHNLQILLKTLVTKILFNKQKVAYGVEVLLNNKQQIIIRAKKEVILCAGAINSPKLLMLSGIGPKEHLNKHNIMVLYESSNVGQNLHDRPLAMVGLTAELDLLSKIKHINSLGKVDYFPVPVIVGYVALDKKQKYPDYQINIAALPGESSFADILCGHVLKMEDDICIAAHDAVAKRRVLFAGNILAHPKSRGSVELQGNNPKQPTAIYTGYYSKNEDLEIHAKCIENYIQVINTTYFKKSNGEIINYNVKQCKRHTFLSREYWKCHILNVATTMWDYGGTCSMGPEGKGVVDERLRVRGVKKLRVVDASVIPTTISGNIKTAVIMIAENACDMIKADNNLE